MFNKQIFLFFIFLIPSIHTGENQLLEEIIEMEYNLFDKFSDMFLRNCSSTRKLLGIDEVKIAQTFKNKLNDVYIKLMANNSTEIFSMNDVDNIVNSPNYDINKSNVIYLHGYNEDSDMEKSVNLVKNIKSYDSVNFMMLDARSMICEFYLISTLNAMPVAKPFGYFLSKMYHQGVKNFHLIGHSLGAHIAGIASKVFKNLTGKKIWRISALDPAGPCFYDEIPENSLHGTDAEFVDIIHSNGNMAGLFKSIGHVDFYPNGGVNMPGCIHPSCFHDKSIDYYAESLSNNNFYAVKCPDYDSFKNGSCSRNPVVKMGHWLLPTVSPGVYFLRTADFPPYALGNFSIISFDV